MFVFSPIFDVLCVCRLTGLPPLVTNPPTEPPIVREFINGTPTRLLTSLTRQTGAAVVGFTCLILVFLSTVIWLIVIYAGRQDGIVDDALYAEGVQATIN